MPTLYPEGVVVPLDALTAFLGVGLAGGRLRVSRLRGQPAVPVQGSLPRRIAAVQAAMSRHDKSHNDHGHGHETGDEIAYGKVIARRRRFAGRSSRCRSSGRAIILSQRDARRSSRRPASRIARRVIEQEEIGIVDQVPFAIDKRLRALEARSTAARLNGYGWVDRSQGHRPRADREAMEAVGRRGAARGSAAMKARAAIALRGRCRAAGGGALRAPRRRRSPSRRAASSRWRRLQDIDVIEHLGERVPAGLTFIDEAGKPVRARLAARTRQAGAGDAGLPPLPDAVRPGARRPGQGGSGVRASSWARTSSPSTSASIPTEDAKCSPQTQRRVLDAGRAATTPPTGRSGRRSATAARRPARSPTRSASATSTTRRASSSPTTRSPSC